MYTIPTAHVQHFTLLILLKEAVPPSCSSKALMRSAGFSYSIRSTLPDSGAAGNCTGSSDCIKDNKTNKIDILDVGTNLVLKNIEN